MTEAIAFYFLETVEIEHAAKSFAKAPTGRGGVLVIIAVFPFNRSPVPDGETPKGHIQMQKGRGEGESLSQRCTGVCNGLLLLCQSHSIFTCLRYRGWGGKASPARKEDHLDLDERQLSSGIYLSSTDSRPLNRSVGKSRYLVCRFRTGSAGCESMQKGCTLSIIILIDFM